MLFHFNQLCNVKAVLYAPAYSLNDSQWKKVYDDDLFIFSKHSPQEIQWFLYCVDDRAKINMNKKKKKKNRSELSFRFHSIRAQFQKFEAESNTI